MTRRRARAVAAVTLSLVCLVALAAVPLVACALDFDRYDPVDGGDGSPMGPQPINVDAAYEASADGARNQPPADASAPDGQAAPCSAPANCIQQAGTCGMACRQTFQNCARRCGDVDVMCQQACTNTRQSCLGRCASTCIGCAQGGGCPVASSCLDAANS